MTQPLCPYKWSITKTWCTRSLHMFRHLHRASSSHKTSTQRTQINFVLFCCSFPSLLLLLYFSYHHHHDLLFKQKKHSYIGENKLNITSSQVMQKKKKRKRIAKANHDLSGVVSGVPGLTKSCTNEEENKKKTVDEV